MKTAMQELIKTFKLYENSACTKVELEILSFYKRCATELLEKEKEQIIKAVEDTRGNIVPRYFLEENLSGEEYYNQTYNK